MVPEVVDPGAVDGLDVRPALAAAGPLRGGGGGPHRRRRQGRGLRRRVRTVEDHLPVDQLACEQRRERGRLGLLKRESWFKSPQMTKKIHNTLSLLIGIAR